MRLTIALSLLCVPVLAAADWKVADTPLTTPWTSQVNPTHALPEYPRPQMVRKDWINLNGLWDYAIRPRETQVKDWDGHILVPFPLESALSGVKKALAPDQLLWYHRSFVAPNLRGKRLLLHFGAADWQTEVWINGKSVGKHEGGYDPFTFDITPALKSGKQNQEIVVSVWDPTDSGGQPRGKQVLHPNSIWYTAVSGIWQTVWLEPVPEHYVSELTMTPDIDGNRLHLTVHSPSSGEYGVRIALAGQTVGQATGQLNTPSEVLLSDIEPWTPDTPTLYDVEISLPEGDRVASYFGMRKVEIRKDSAGFNRIFLNGAPLFTIGPLDQGWWPDGLYTAPTDAALRSDIETLKRMGFNMCRKHVKVEPARYYYWCDKLGFLIWQDMPSAMPKDHPAVKRNGGADLPFTTAEDADYRRELEAEIHNLHNVTSIVAWVPFNEGWGQHDTNAILRWAKSLDGSRLVDGPSGWEDRGYGDMKDMHDYPGPAMYPVMDDRASVLGEFGGLGLPIEGHLWWNQRNWGYRTFADTTALEAGYEALMQKLEGLVRQGLAAAVYTQTTDVEGEVNGLMTYDRKVIKYDVDKLAQWHKRLIAEGSGKGTK
ncbi:MAG TPA: glycoside hydrolase family 2 TIM barrel-domain containing protein [Bryobacteraceae bacterium]|nr:glycoside hydrolase family 2 TIM barrel-domain containing protein [Bryobacteraceae bacterium]